MTILDDIVADKRNIVARAKRDTPVSDLEGMPLFSRPTLDLRGSLTAAPVFALIAEIKRAYVDPPATKVRHQGKEVLALGVSMAKGGDIIAMGKALSVALRPVGLAASCRVRLEALLPFLLASTRAGRFPKVCKSMSARLVAGLYRARAARL